MTDVLKTLRSALTFELPSDSPHFGPRTGKITIQKQAGSLQLETPAFMASTTRGVVPHLSRDNVRNTEAIRWVHVPFESFLERAPPVPTLQGGPHALHTFLGFAPARHVVSMSARDPHDGREMPPNGGDHVAAYCVRGVRKTTAAAWISYAMACDPDLVVGLSDTPFTPAPHSQKRLTKSIERSAAWLAELLSATTDAATGLKPQNILYPLGGGANVQARRAFSESLLESLDSKELDRIRPLQSLDEGVSGYVFDLVPLRAAFSSGPSALETTTGTGILTLLRASLEPLSPRKPRLVNSAKSPHEMLRLIREVGIDLFDAHWAQRAADVGVALDFRFPVPSTGLNRGLDGLTGACSLPKERKFGIRDLGHNLYDPSYAHDHVRLASSFVGAASGPSAPLCPVCGCAACSPAAAPAILQHSTLDDAPDTHTAPLPLPPFTRAYVHHLLHTHEMSAHALLAMHNLAVVDAFLAGVRGALAADSDDVSEEFGRQADAFLATYDEDMLVIAEAEAMWQAVDRARGKGRLAREKLKQQAGSSPGAASPSDL